MTSINLLHVSAPGCHPQVTALKQMDTSPAR